PAMSGPTHHGFFKNPINMSSIFQRVGVSPKKTAPGFARQRSQWRDECERPARSFPSMDGRKLENGYGWKPTVKAAESSGETALVRGSPPARQRRRAR